MRRRRFLSALALAIPATSYAQRKEPLPQIGLIWLGSEGGAGFKESLISGMREHGYVNGRDVQVLDRTEVSRYESLARAAKELVAANVQVVVAYGGSAPRAVHEASSTIPIVMIGSDPVILGLAKSLSHPGGNVTGVATLLADLVGKRLQLLTECVHATRVAVLVNPASSSSRYLPEVESEARRLKLQLQVFGATEPRDFDPVLASIAQTHTKAVFVLTNTMFTANRSALAAAALHNRLALVGSTAEYVDAGALLGYGPKLSQMFRQAGGYVVRILNGERPAEMAMQQPSEFEFAINLKTAKAIGVNVPDTLRFRATKLVE